jgi:hypothetical protein
VSCTVTTPAANLHSGGNHSANADDTNRKKAPWYSDFIEGGELAKSIVRDVYLAFTWASVWQMTMDRFPFLRWMQTYSLVRFVKDVQAGFVVATLVIPQVRNKEPSGHDDRKVRKCRRILIMSLLLWRYIHIWQGMSYADIAGLPLVAGLYADFAPLIIYSFFGSSKQIAVGPVAIIALLVYQSIPLCNKLCAENKGVNASVPVRCKWKTHKDYRETLPLFRPLATSACISSVCLPDSLSHRVCVSDDTHYTQIPAAYGKCPSKCTATQTLIYNPEVHYLFL